MEWLPASLTYSTLPAASRATPRGWENVAAVPMPSALPVAALPASVLTAPLATPTARTLLFCQSPTYSTPAGCHTAVEGRLNWATAPTPSAKPHTPLPASRPVASVATTSVRMRHPPFSTIKPMLPLALKAREAGWSSSAAVPVPSAPPAAPLPTSTRAPPPPTTVMRCAKSSATYTLPPSTATPCGPTSPAATVLTRPPAVTFLTLPN